MSIDVIERRRVVEERLRRARDLARALDQAAGDIADSSGQGIEKLDPDGTLRTAVTTLAGVAALRPGFDVLVSLPNSPHALRVRHEAADVDITLVHLTAQPAPETPAGAEPEETPAAPEATEAPPIPAQAGEPELSEPEAVAVEAAEPDTSEPDDHVVSDLAAMLWQGVGPPST